MPTPTRLAQLASSAVVALIAVPGCGTAVVSQRPGQSLGDGSAPLVVTGSPVGPMTVEQRTSADVATGGAAVVSAGQLQAGLDVSASLQSEVSAALADLRSARLQLADAATLTGVSSNSERTTLTHAPVDASASPQVAGPRLAGVGHNSSQVTTTSTTTLDPLLVDYMKSLAHAGLAVLALFLSAVVAALLWQATAIRRLAVAIAEQPERLGEVVGRAVAEGLHGRRHAA